MANESRQFDGLPHATDELLAPNETAVGGTVNTWCELIGPL